MENRCVVLVSNRRYLRRAKRTIRQLRNEGRYDGPVVLVVGDDLRDRVASLEQKLAGVEVKYFPDLDRDEITRELKEKALGDGRSYLKRFQWHKLYCFHPWFTRWDRCLYLDAGIYVYKPIDPVWTIDSTGGLVAHSDAYPSYERTLKTQFDSEHYPDLYRILERKFDLDRDYFQSTIMLYDTAIIEPGTFDMLKELSKRYINSLTNEQAIMNLYFNGLRNVWRRLPAEIEGEYFYDFHERNGQTYRDYRMLKYPKTDFRAKWVDFILRKLNTGLRVLTGKS